MTKAQRKAKAKEHYIRLYNNYVSWANSSENQWGRALAAVVDLQCLLEDLQIAGKKDFELWNKEVYVKR